MDRASAAAGAATLDLSDDFFALRLRRRHLRQLMPESIKPSALLTSNNRVMNAVVDAALRTEGEVAELTAMLAQWYADHAAIRRLWAIEGTTALEVLVALEPNFDANDMLPVWRANRRFWTRELCLLAGREVQLRLVVLDDFGEFYVNPDAVTIAELSWRVSWYRETLFST